MTRCASLCGLCDGLLGADAAARARRAPPPVSDGHHAPGHHDVLRRHRSLVRADRRGPARQASGRPAATGAAPTTSRASRTSATSPATFGVGIKDRAEVFGSFLVDHAHRSRPAAALHRPTARSAASSIAIPASRSGWTGDNVGDFYLGVKFNLLSECAAETGGARGARHGQAADRRHAMPASAPGKTDVAFDVIVSKEARRNGRSVGLRRLRVPRQRRRRRRRRAARSGGAPAPASRRAARCAARSSSTASSRRRDVATLSGASIVGVDGSRAADHVGD